MHLFNLDFQRFFTKNALMRAFVSINLDAEIKNQIAEIQHVLKDKLNNPFNVKLENPKNFHLTLFFMRDVEEGTLFEIKNEINKNVEGKFGELHFECNHIGAFPNLKNPRVIFLNCDNKENKIHELANEIKSVLYKFGFTQDKPFHPHITLARIKDRIKINDVSGLNINIKFSAARLSFMKSELTSKGAVHKEVFDINL
jgi:2'-5' RNA ligase